MEDVAMRNINLDPYWRTSIGFDRLFDLMDESLRFEPEDHYPPYNIVRTGEDSYRISLAVAGFKPEQISITVHQNTLTVTGRVNDKQGEADYLYRGIAGRPFERRFNLADFVEVKRASFEDGLLQIELEREVPEVHEAAKGRSSSRKGASAERQDEDHRTQQGRLVPDHRQPDEVARLLERATSLRARRMAMKHQSKKPETRPPIRDLKASSISTLCCTRHAPLRIHRTSSAIPT